MQKNASAAEVEAAQCPPQVARVTVAEWPPVAAAAAAVVLLAIIAGWLCFELLAGASADAGGRGAVWPAGPHYRIGPEKVQAVDWQPDRPFADWLVERREPVVLTNTLAKTKWQHRHPPAAGGPAAWSPGWLAARLPSPLPGVQVGSSPVFQYFNEELRDKTEAMHAAAAPGFDRAPPPLPRQAMTVAGFWAAAKAQNSTGRWVLLSTPLYSTVELAELATAELRGLRLWSLPARCGTAADGATPPPAGSLGAALGLDGVGGSGGGGRPHWQLWMGGGGVTSQPHFDQQHNIYLQLHGTKRFLLSPPAEARRAEVCYAPRNSKSGHQLIQNN